jgi:hypothetical protein
LIATPEPSPARSTVAGSIRGATRDDTYSGEGCIDIAGATTKEGLTPLISQGVGATNPIAGGLLPFEVDEVLVSCRGVPRLFAGHGPEGQRWLVAQIAEGLDTCRWLCAPASDRAIGCALSGRATPADLFRHSATGTVEDVTISSDGTFLESTRLCAELSDDEVQSASQAAS